ncbi:hypothetical protein JRQ81_015474 [Phrynocephalus forsythii]|uniref:C-type lectin domain-containing protein n=1 Tax=Phrynocephalus forsythii TaxID=171643 RepID=A0A9Q1B1T3_9SAUR|nr:hypothetical protein JRQ81_015474 [Phrynocephalus forsythii]
MAPKKPPVAAKESTAPGDPAKGPPGEEPPKKPYIETPEGGRMVRIMAVVWFILAVIMVTLYAILLNKDWNIRQALIMMREFAIEYDPRYEERSDLQVIALGQNLSSTMLEWVDKNEELQAEIDKLAKTLDQWVAYDKNLYHFSKDLATYDDAVEECVTKESGLVFVKWGEEQSFIDETAIKLKKDFWIGLKKNTSAHNSVIWIGGHRAGTTYWDSAASEPKMDAGDCIFVAHSGKPKQCWHVGKCATPKQYVCKKEPKAKWYYA